MGKGVPVQERKLTGSRIEELLGFDPGTGIFRWKQRRSNVAAGSVAGRKWKNGYVYIRIDNEDYLAGRLAWLWAYGKWPTGVLRYNDGNKGNNRPCNLRDATVVRGKHNWRTKEGKAAYQLEYRQDKREVFRYQEIQRKLGLTAEQYQAKLDAQGGVCAICKKAETAVSRMKKVRWLAVDHDHDTKEVRELLCNACNVIIGLSGEDVTVLENCIAYLKKHKANQLMRAN